MPTPWDHIILVVLLIGLPIVFLIPSLRRFYRHLAGHSPPDIEPLSLYHRSLCLLFVYIFLLSPECLDMLARADGQYLNLSTSAWGSGNRTIFYLYDDNGSQIRKTTKKTLEEEIIEVVEYEYNLQNRLSKAVTTTYSEGQLVNTETVEYRYDPAGIRTEKVVDNTIKTEYLVDPENHTGYAQVLEESEYDISNPASPVLLSTLYYTIGDDVISQTKAADFGSGWTLADTEYLLYDGHGSTRQITLPNKSVIHNYCYDGYGIMLGSTGSVADNAKTSMLYTGEQYDKSIDQYYLRARYYNQSNGTFNRVDPYSGNLSDPQSLHKYLYCHANPVNGIDPQGKSMLLNLTKTTAIMGIIAGIVYASVGAVFDIARGDSTAWEIVRNAIFRFGVTFTSFVCPLFMIILLAVGTACLLSTIASGEMEKRDWIELGVFIVISLVLLLIFRNAGLLGESGAAANGGHHSIIPKGGTGRLSIRGFFKNQWGRFIPKFIRESSANVIKKGATQAEYLLWHFRVDPNFFGAKGWIPPAGVAKYGVISRLWHGSPSWLQNTGLYLVFTNGTLYIIGAVKSNDLADDVVEPEYIDPSHPAAEAIQEEE